MNPTPGTFGEHLISRVGAASLAAGDFAARISRSLGPRGATVVLAPSDPAGVCHALAECAAEGWPVLGAGAGTWISEAVDSTVDRAPVVISTVRLDRVTEHEPADLVVGAEAGIPLTRLRERLAEKDQWLPLDPAATDFATVGAMAALGSAGPLRAGFGTLRDMVLGVELATGDGRLLRFGGRVVKNVAGYDGVRLAIGSRGSLGIITGLYLRVRGTPRVDRTLAIACGPGGDGALRGAAAALAIRDSVAADALELLSPAVAARVGSGTPPNDWTLLVRLLGGEAAVTESVERVKQLAGRGFRSVSLSAALPLTEPPTQVWLALSRLEADATLAVTLTGSTTALPEGLRGIADILTPAGRSSGWMAAAHAADGVIRLWRPDLASAAADALRAVVDGIAADGAGAGWTVRYDKPPSSRDARTEARAVRELTRRLTAVFDPAGIMQSGAEVP